MVGPQHLVNWTKVAWNKETEGILDAASLKGLHHPGPLPKAPSDGVPGQTRPRTHQTVTLPQDDLREQIRAIIAEELRAVMKD